MTRKRLTIEFLYTEVCKGEGEANIDTYQLTLHDAYGRQGPTQLAPRMETPQIEFNEKTGRLTVYRMP